MREIRLYGSEGGVALTTPSLPLSPTLTVVQWREPADTPVISVPIPFVAWAPEVKPPQHSARSAPLREDRAARGGSRCAPAGSP